MLVLQFTWSADMLLLMETGTSDYLQHEKHQEKTSYIFPGMRRVFFSFLSIQFLAALSSLLRRMPFSKVIPLTGFLIANLQDA